MKFRPRFSVRTLAIVVTLVCAYFGAWEATKRYGIGAACRYSAESGRIPRGVLAPYPLVLTSWEYTSLSHNWNQSICYYLWLFGLTIKLPFESELK